MIRRAGIGTFPICAEPIGSLSILAGYARLAITDSAVFALDFSTALVYNITRTSLPMADTVLQIAPVYDLAQTDIPVAAAVVSGKPLYAIAPAQGSVYDLGGAVLALADAAMVGADRYDLVISDQSLYDLTISDTAVHDEIIRDA